MSDLVQLFLKQQETKTAFANYCLASTNLDLAKIRERLAEAKSQHDPLASIITNASLSDREKLYAAAFWVVIGKLP